MSPRAARPDVRCWHTLEHLATWPNLKRGAPVDAAVLIVNHQHRAHPLDRIAPYTRREFIDSLEIPVTSTVQLFNWWRAGDPDAIRVEVFGPSPGTERIPDLLTGAEPDLLAHSLPPALRRMLDRFRRQ